jgi:hypothetical protein
MPDKHIWIQEDIRQVRPMMLYSREQFSLIHMNTLDISGPSQVSLLYVTFSSWALLDGGPAGQTWVSPIQNVASFVMKERRISSISWLGVFSLDSFGSFYSNMLV